MLNLLALVRARKLVIAAMEMAAALCLLATVNYTVVRADQKVVDDVVGSAANAEPSRTAYLNIRFQPDLSETERHQIIAQVGGELAGWIAPLHIASIAVSAGEISGSAQQRSTYEAFIPLLPQQQAGLLGATQFYEIDAPVSGFNSSSETLPNDPDFQDSDRSYSFKAISVIDAWSQEQGRTDVIIAVVDTGVSLTHPEFSGRLQRGYDFVNNDAEPLDDHGHGTHVTGIIAGAVNNHTGVAGICPGCGILPVKVLDAANIGTWFTAAQGIVYAVDNGAHIINLSLGASTPSSTIEAAINYAHNKGVLIVGAAGNAGSSEPFYPAAYENVLSVGATTSDDTLWSMSNHGASLDVTAPGELIYNASPDINNNYGGFTFKSGTSMASPHVAGLAGLLLSQDSSRDTDTIERIILNTSDDLGEIGWDSNFGYGRINAAAALQYGQTISGGSFTPKSNHKDMNELFLPAFIGH